MVSLHHRLISLPATCLLTGAMTVAGLGGCATNRQTRTAHQHCWHFGHHAATPSPTPATSPTPAPAVTDDPGQIYRVNPAPNTPDAGTRDKMPNFLPEKMPEDGNLEAPGPGASLKRKGSTLAGNQKAGATARNDKAKGKAKGGRQEAEDPADNGPVPRLHPDDKVARRDNKRTRKQTARDAALQAKRGTTTNAVPTSNPVRLGKPPEIYTFTDDAEQRRQPERTEYAPQESTFHPTVRNFRQSGLPAQTVSSPVQNYPVQNYPQQNYPVPQYQQYQPQQFPAQQYYPPSGNDEFVPLPLWSDSAAGQSQPLIRSRPQNLQSPPVTSSSPPARFTSYDAREVPRRQESVQEPSGPFSISRLAICSEVRGYENFTEMDAGDLRSGQKFLIYASLENFKSVSTMNGYQTLTLSSLEVCTRSGKRIVEQPLGTATDMSDSLRQQYYLTHMVHVPDNLPAGDYVVTLNVYDLSSKQTTKSMIGMRITAGRGRQG